VLGFSPALSQACIAKPGTQEPTDRVQHTRAKQDVSGRFVAIHHEKDKATGHEHKGDARDNLAAEGVPILLMQLSVDGFNDQSRKGLVDLSIGLKDFRT
jgi:hypothetical protein